MGYARSSDLVYYSCMGIEGEPNKEVLSRGRLYFLSHPGSEIFSGYGLTTHEGRMDRLVGLLMVDRPHPVDPTWLAEIERRYGVCQLTPMTRGGERGLVTQMRIEAPSQGFLQPGTGVLTGPLTKALEPLLDAPPAPVLKLRWDAERTLWSSEFWVGLPPALQEVFEQMGEGCLAVERDDRRVTFVTHAADEDIERFRDAPALWRWELIPMPTAPLIRFYAAILDDPTSAYELEHFLNVSDRSQARCLARLVDQPELTFDFFGDEYEYRYSKGVAHPRARRQDLQAMVRRAVDLYGAIAPAARDFDRAKAEFQRDNSL